MKGGLYNMVIDISKDRKTRRVALSIPFGERVAVARKNQGWTQDKLAAFIGYSQSIISRMESGVLEFKPADAAAAARAIGNSQLLEHFCSDCPVATAYRQLRPCKGA